MWLKSAGNNSRRIQSITANIFTLKAAATVCLCLLLCDQLQLNQEPYFTKDFERNTLRKKKFAYSGSTTLHLNLFQVLRSVLL
ncbi:hypothetical protein AOLI_G00107550 [Acnodon oligacanthus]